MARSAKGFRPAGTASCKPRNAIDFAHSWFGSHKEDYRRRLDNNDRQRLLNSFATRRWQCGQCCHGRRPQPRWQRVHETRICCGMVALRGISNSIEYRSARIFAISGQRNADQLRRVSRKNPKRRSVPTSRNRHLIFRRSLRVHVHPDAVAHPAQSVQDSGAKEVRFQRATSRRIQYKTR